MSRIYTLLIVLIAAVFAAGCTAQLQQSQANPTPAATIPVPPTATATEAIPVTVGEPTQAVTVLPAETEPAPTPEQAEVQSPVVFAFSPGEGKARYRVREQLVNLTLPNDAVGETDQITGSVAILPDGTVDGENSRFEVNLASLVSDQSRRDNFLRNNVLQTGQYPSAVFIPRSITGLEWPVPASGAVQFQLLGDLTIRDVTREVTWDVSGTLQDGTGTGQAVTRFTFADFNLTQPRVPVVLSIEDEIVLEVEGTIRRQ